MTHVLTASLRAALSEDLADASAAAYEAGDSLTADCREEELAQLRTMRDGEPMTGALLDAAGYMGYVDL